MIWAESQVVINCTRKEEELNVIDLVHWCERIYALKSSFLTINFSHIYREHKSNADALYKESLSIDMGTLSCLEFLDGEKIGFTTI